MNSVSEINVKSRTNNFFDEFVSTKNLDPKKIKIDENSFSNILVYFTGCVTVKNLSFAMEINI